MANRSPSTPHLEEVWGRERAHLAESSQVPVLALHQELGCDVSGWFDLAGFFILLVQLFHSFFGVHHLRGEGEEEEGYEDTFKFQSAGKLFCVAKLRASALLVFTLLRRSLSSS